MKDNVPVPVGAPVTEPLTVAEVLLRDRLLTPLIAPVVTWGNAQKLKKQVVVNEPACTLPSMTTFDEATVTPDVASMFTVVILLPKSVMFRLSTVTFPV